MLVLLCGFLWEGCNFWIASLSFQIFPRLPLLWILLGALILSGITWLFAQTSLARQRLGQVTVFLTAGQVIMLMQLMAALKNLDFQWTGHWNMQVIIRVASRRVKNVANTGEHGCFDVFWGFRIGPAMSTSTWAEVAPKQVQVAACWTQVGAKLEPCGLGPSWGFVGRCWGHAGSKRCIWTMLGR